MPGFAPQFGNIIGWLSLLFAFTYVKAENIVFNSPVGLPDASGSFGPFYTSPALRFTAVTVSGGKTIDAQVVATPWNNVTFGSGTNSGHYGNYSPNAAQPNGDAGLYYTSPTVGRGGIHYDIDFFESGSNFTIPSILDQFSLMVYDIDGDAFQREEVSARFGDGLTSYRLSNGISTLTANPVPGGINFIGKAENFPETSIQGAVILSYAGTGHVRLDFSALTSGGVPNGSFAAIDGDLSFLQGDFSGFNPVVNVPEPGIAGLLAGMAAAGLLIRRKG